MCDDVFTDINAKVVCRQLGYSTLNAVAHSNAFYGRGSGTIWLDQVTCSGFESRLSDCSSNVWGNNDCGHSEDVGIKCGKSSRAASCLPCIHDISVSFLHVSMYATLSYRTFISRIILRLEGTQPCGYFLDARA